MRETNSPAVSLLFFRAQLPFVGAPSISSVESLTARSFFSGERVSVVFLNAGAGLIWDGAERPV